MIDRPGGRPRFEGRYHRAGGTRTWYGSSTEAAAWAEFLRHFRQPDLDPGEVLRRVGRVTFDELIVCDLTDPDLRRGLGVTESDLTADSLGVCQELAEAAIDAGFEAVLAPSAALPGEHTLAVFGDAIMERISAVADRGRRLVPTQR